LEFHVAASDQPLVIRYTFTGIVPPDCAFKFRSMSAVDTTAVFGMLVRSKSRIVRRT
jgi:hypothetical protein